MIKKGLQKSPDREGADAPEQNPEQPVRAQNRYSLTIDPEFKFLGTTRTEEENKFHENSLKMYGCIDPIVVWKGHNIIIDGHNRFDICERLDISYKIHQVSFKSREIAINYIIENQLGRRNLTESQKSYYRGKRYNNEKKTHGRPKSDHADHIKTLGKTSEKIAKQLGVAPATIRRDAEFAEAIDSIKADTPEFGKKLIDEQIKLAKKEVKDLSKDTTNMKALAEKIEGGVKTLAEARRQLGLETDASNGRNSKFNRDEDEGMAMWTWNPVVGCKRECDYCYARDFHRRFYPGEDFSEPRFFEKRLDAPRNTQVPDEAADHVSQKNVFVCSMADLFGDWVPQEWINKVLQAVRGSPQWNYLFVTKSPERLINIDWPDNAWVGTTVDVQNRVEPAENAFRQIKATVKFVVCEPLQEEVTFSDLSMFDWILIGGRRKSSGADAFQPQWPWVESLLIQARNANLPVLFKPNLTAKPREFPTKQVSREIHAAENTKPLDAGICTKGICEEKLPVEAEAT